MRRIAVIGTGIAGSFVAHRLHPHCDVSVYEGDTRPGGHAHTVNIVLDGETIAVDTGFIVYNEETYPGLTSLFDTLDVATQPTDMGFGVRSESNGLEYSSRNLRGMFAQPLNLLSPRFWSIWRDFFRFRTAAFGYLKQNPDDLDTTLGEFVDSGRYGTPFQKYLLYAMGGAIWSTEPSHMRDFPLTAYLRFMSNHRMLDPSGQPQWRTVVGGSREYVQKLTAPFRDRIRLRARVHALVRRADCVEVHAEGQPVERFDEVVVATHSDQALAMLDNATPTERAVLGAIRYQPNDAVLHTDRSMLPRSQAARAAWNMHLPANDRDVVSVTYDMNILQALDTRHSVCVTLNRTDEIDPDLIHGQFRYDHPQFDRAAIAAQRRWHEISGVDRIHYAGAYWRFGFHEDGLWSGSRVADAVLDSEKQGAAAHA